MCGKVSQRPYIGQLCGKSQNFPTTLRNVPGITRTFLKPYIHSRNHVNKFLKFPAFTILRRPFLATVGVVINVKEGLMTFDIGGEVMEFQNNGSFDPP